MSKEVYVVLSNEQPWIPLMPLEGKVIQATITDYYLSVTCPDGELYNIEVDPDWKFQGGDAQFSIVDKDVFAEQDYYTLANIIKECSTPILVNGRKVTGARVIDGEIHLEVK